MLTYLTVKLWKIPIFIELGNTRYYVSNKKKGGTNTEA